MGILERRKINKVRENIQEANTNKEAQIEIDSQPSESELYEQQKQSRNRLIRAIVLETIGGLFIYQILQTQIGGGYAIIITISQIFTIGLILWFLANKLYQPPSLLFVNVHLIDENNTDSMYAIEKWAIPKKIIDEHLIDGSQYAMMTTDGLAFFTDELDFNPTTKRLHVKFGYQNLDRFAFNTDKRTFENVTKINAELLKKTSLLESQMELTINLESRKQAKKWLRLILATREENLQDIALKSIETIKQDVRKTNDTIKLLTNPESQED